MSSRLLPQWLCVNSCTWAHDVRLHIAGTNEPKSAQQAKDSMCSRSLMTTYIMLLAWLLLQKSIHLTLRFSNNGLTQATVQKHLKTSGHIQ